MAAERLATDPTSDGPTFAAAIVVAGTACEVAAQRAVEAFIDARSLGALGEAVKGYQRRYTFVNDDRLQKLWLSLTGDEIQKAKFWLGYVKHVQRRNRAAHSGLNRGTDPTRKDAEKSIDAAKRFIEHIQAVLSANGLSSAI